MNDSKQCIMLSSITYAMRGKELLAHYGIKAFMEKTPSEVSGCGCGYSLRVKGDVDRAVTILKGAGIEVRKVYTG